MTTICGHERTLVAEALQMMDGVSDGLLRVMVAGVRAKGNGGPKADAVEALLDPAKLIKMMAEEARRLGWYLSGEPSRGIQGLPWIQFELDKLSILVWVMADRRPRPYMRKLSMSQACTVLRRWLDLIDKDFEGAEHVLRGET